MSAIHGGTSIWKTVALLSALLLVVAVMFAVAPPAEAETLYVDTTVVPVGGEPHDVVVDMARGVAYVSITATDEIVTVNMATGAVSARRFFSDPTGLDLSADGQYLYVALNASTGIARVDLSDWTSDQVVLVELGDHRTWDVIEIEPGVVLVSADPGSNGLAWIVRYNFNTAAEDVVANNEIIRAGPRFAMNGGDYVYVGSGFSPNSIYKLDLATPLLDIVAEDNHGGVSVTQSLAVSVDGTFLVTGAGQKVDANTIVSIGSYEPGVPLFSDDGSLLYTLRLPYLEPATILVSNADTTQSIEEWNLDCGATKERRIDTAFTKGTGSPTLVATTTDSLCLIHTDTVGPPPPPPPPPTPGGGRFFDDDSSVHQAAIEAIAAVGITKGCNPPYQTGFCPRSSVTRGQMAAFMVRAFGLTDDGGGNSFIDDDGSIFEADIAKLAAAGITKGCNPAEGNTKFCPDAKVTRGQMAAFLVRAFGYSDGGGSNLFTDDDESIFESDIDRLGTVGITKGCNPPANTKFCPNSPVSREQMATFMARALELSVPSIPPRAETIVGTNLDVIPTAEMVGCSGDNGEVCTMGHGVYGEFYLLSGWFQEDWSASTSAEKAVFESNQVRLEATFDGVPIELVAWPIEVVDDMALKTYSFQFPEWLAGSHVLEIYYIDDSENYRWTIRDNLTAFGSGYTIAGAAATLSSSDEGVRDGETHLSSSR